MESPDENIIVFNNLVQADDEFAGGTRPVKVKISEKLESFKQPNAKGELYRPKSLDDVKERACAAGVDFLERQSSFKKS